MKDNYKQKCIECSNEDVDYFKIDEQDYDIIYYTCGDCGMEFWYNHRTGEHYGENYNHGK